VLSLVSVMGKLVTTLHLPPRRLVAAPPP